MKLGVYRVPTTDTDSDNYVRLASYDFDAEMWDESSEGNVVSQASKKPTPEELKVRFDLDPDARRTIVATPEAMADAGYNTELVNAKMSVEEGHKTRQERGGPLVTQTERQAQRRRGVRVFPDDYNLSDASRKFYEENDETVIRESAWEFDFAKEYDFEF
jgi:hypothetical protein